MTNFEHFIYPYMNQLHKKTVTTEAATGGVL